ncbi:MAG: low affinity iron permease family protein [Polyangiaceae bacterium]
MRRRNRDHRTTFAKFAEGSSTLVGSPYAFLSAVLLVFAWVTSGPLFGFSDTWQLVINTSTTIVTFLMVFLIQHTQNRDTEAMRLKLDELVRAVREADNRFLAVEDMDDRERERVQRDFLRLAARKRNTQDNDGGEAA